MSLRKKAEHRGIRKRMCLEKYGRSISQKQEARYKKRDFIRGDTRFVCATNPKFFILQSAFDIQYYLSSLPRVVKPAKGRIVSKSKYQNEIEI